MRAAAQRSGCEAPRSHANLYFSEDGWVALVEPVTRMTSAPAEKRLKTVGVWLGFPEPVSLYREGIGRFLQSLCFSLVRDFGVSLEFWCYEINRAATSALFRNVLAEATLPTTVKILTDRDDGGTAMVSSDGFGASPPAAIVERTLEDMARQYSCADVFLVYSPRLHNVLSINRPKVVYLPDLAPLVYAERREGLRGTGSGDLVELRTLLEAFADSGAAFCCNSRFVAREHLQKHLPSSAAGRIHSVFLPGIPPESEPEDSDVAEVRNKFGLVRPFLFYPTQNRPYKRLELLIQALAELTHTAQAEDGGPETDRLTAPDLVLTVSGSAVDPLKSIAEELGVASRVHFPGAVSSRDLYALHKAAAVTVVTTLFEGGFPWQAIESMSCHTPVVMSRIPVVEERLQSLPGVSCDDLLLFEPDNLTELCRCIRHALRDRESVVKAQHRVVRAFSSYTWTDAAAQYCEILSGQMKSQCREVSFAARRSLLQRILGRIKRCWPFSCVDDLYRHVQLLEHSQSVLQAEISHLRNEVMALGTRAERDRLAEAKEKNE